MPSIVLGQPYQSGAVQIITGNPWSGILIPTGGIQLRWISSGGNACIAFSGGGPPLSGGFMTLNSGQMPLSGGAASGMLDGMVLSTGDAMFIPRTVLSNRAGTTSGIVNLYALCDLAASGVGRLYFEIF